MWQLLNVRDDDKCYLDMEGIQGAEGDSFLRNLYLTYDYDKLTIEISMPSTLPRRILCLSSRFLLVPLQHCLSIAPCDAVLRLIIHLYCTI